ncbi:MAG TPA: hypothetical protein DEF04_08915, partial [Clostridiales bacterium]|nr:hypothetical protein [Clostridiales bacterium]
SNPPINRHPVYAGQIINIPGFTYTVRQGDTLNKISGKFNIPLNMLLSLNPRIACEGNITEGQNIFITNRPSAGNSEQIFSIEKNSESIMSDIDSENWTDAEQKASQIKSDFTQLTPFFIEQGAPEELITTISDAITKLLEALNSKNVHLSKVQAFIIGEYYSDILDILRRNNQIT